jgi:hypothetical protein
LLEHIENIEFFALMAASTPSPYSDVAPTGPQVLAVLSNAGSTQNLADGAWLEATLAGEPNVLSLAVTGPDDIGAAISRAIDANAQVIVVNGGDGTADLVMGALLTMPVHLPKPALALLAAGKTNMTAAAWSFGGDKVEALQRIVAARRKGTLLNHVRERHVLKIERGGDNPPLYGAFFGAADVVDGILFCRKHIYPMKLPNALSHPLAIGLLLWRAMVSGSSAEPVRVRWDDGQSEDGRFFLVSATTLDTLITGLTPIAETGTGPLTYLSLRPGVQPLLSVMPKLFTKDIGTGAGRIVRRAKSVTMTFDGAFTLDGEMFETTRNTPITLSADDRLRFIRMTDR